MWFDGTRNFSCVRIEKRDSVASVKPLSSKHGGGDVDKARELFVSLLPPQGEASSVTERMRVLSQLGRGDIGDALRVLRRARANLNPKDHAQRCQASLAIAVALSVVGRSQEALLEGMECVVPGASCEGRTW